MTKKSNAALVDQQSPFRPQAHGDTSLNAPIESITRKRLSPTLALVDPVEPDAVAEEGNGVWGSGDQMRALARTIDQIADCDVTVLIRGESGVGKGLVARALHDRSSRRTAAFVKVNCAALPAELLESELFGHERGAFTGAVASRLGKFELADRGTLLLDEIGELKPSLQAKLLHVLQDGEFTKLGSNKLVQVAVRVLASTNCNLEQMRLSGGFREDLYFRLGAIELTIPPLRERPDEILGLTDLFLAQYSREYGRSFRPLSADLRQLFTLYDWPGNVRELENMIKRIVILQDEDVATREIQQQLRRTLIVQGVETSATARSSGVGSSPERWAGAGARGAAKTHEDASAEETEVPSERQSLVGVAKAAALRAEREVIGQTLGTVHWNRRKAAQMLGVSYKTLLNKMKTCGITQN
jgi:two-component system, NtrC family, response regulator AtoC